MAGLATPRAELLERIEVGRLDEDMPLLRGIDQHLAVPVGNPARPTPAVDARHRNADFQGESFNGRLHAPIFVKSTSASRSMLVAGVAMAQKTSPCQNLVMAAKRRGGMQTRTELQLGWAKRVRLARLAAGYKRQEDLERRLLRCLRAGIDRLMVCLLVAFSLI